MSVFDNGYWKIAAPGRIPIRMHWSAPLGALLLGGLRPLHWLSFLLIIMIHELGHAVLIRRARLRVESIDITGFGGLCRWSGRPSVDQRGLIAWGGILAQLGLAALLVPLALGTLALGWGGAADWVSHLVWTNLLIVAVNLLPFPPLDGAEAWPFLARRAQGWNSALNLKRWTSWWKRRRGRQVVERVLGQRSPSADSASAGRDSPRRAPEAREKAGTPAPDPVASRELADLLQRISEEAGRARRGKKD